VPQSDVVDARVFQMAYVLFYLRRLPPPRAGRRG